MRAARGGKLLLCAFLWLLAGVALAASPELVDLGVGRSRGYLVCYWRLEGVPVEELDEALRHGIPLEIRFEIRLLEIRALRRDREVIRYDAAREIFFDPVKKIYFVNFIGLPRLPEQAMSLEEALEIAGNVSSLPLLPMSRLVPDRTYRLKVKAVLRQKVSPGLPARVLRFIFRSGRMETGWASVRFEL